MDEVILARLNKALDEVYKNPLYAQEINEKPKWEKIPKESLKEQR